MAEIMTDFFVGMLERSIKAGVLILLVAFIRRAIPRIPKKVICFLWMLAALRLVVPVTIESRLGLMPDVGGWLEERIASDETYLTGFPQETAADGTNATVLRSDREGTGDDTAAGLGDTDRGLAGEGEKSGLAGARGISKHRGLLTVAAVWAAGTEMMLLYGIYCVLRTRRLVKEAVIWRENIKLCDRIDTAFVFGGLRPEIYIPFGTEEEQLEFILAHERAHIARRDHLSKAAGFLILCCYWFNPLAWLAYVLFCRDMEMACDELVVRQLGEETKQAYSRTLLQGSIAGSAGFAAPPAFGGRGVKERVGNILNYRKPGAGVMTLSVILCLAVGGCGFTAADSGNGEPSASDDAGQQTGQTSGRNVEELVGVKLPDEDQISRISCAVKADGIADMVMGIAFDWEGENAYTSQSENALYHFAGGIYQVPDAGEHFIFRDGQLTGTDLVSEEQTLASGYLVNCQEQAVIYELEGERFTEPELEAAQMHGEPIPEDEEKARLYFAAFARENASYGYVLILNERFFTQEEMLGAVQSVTFADNAWYE